MNKKGQTHNKICKFCKNEFLGRLNQKYCSRSCIARSVNSKRNTQVKHYCQFCKKEYHVVLCRSKSSKYCSQNCNIKAITYRRLVESVIKNSIKIEKSLEDQLLQ